MIYEFIKNGEILLKLEPEDIIEQALFKALFGGEVTVKMESATNHNDSVTIRVKLKDAKV